MTPEESKEYAAVYRADRDNGDLPWRPGRLVTLVPPNITSEQAHQAAKFMRQVEALFRVRR